MGAQVSIAAEVAQVKDAQLRVGARAEELTAKTDNLTLGVKDVLDRVAEVGADTMTIRGVAEQIKNEELVILGLEPRLRLLADALVVRAALTHLIAHAPMLASIRVCGMVRKGRRIADSLRVVQLFEEARRKPGIGHMSEARKCYRGRERVRPVARLIGSG